MFQSVGFPPNSFSACFVGFCLGIVLLFSSSTLFVNAESWNKVTPNNLPSESQLGTFVDARAYYSPSRDIIRSQLATWSDGVSTQNIFTYSESNGRKEYDAFTQYEYSEATATRFGRDVKYMVMCSLKQASIKRWEDRSWSTGESIAADPVLSSYGYGCNLTPNATFVFLNGVSEGKPVVTVLAKDESTEEFPTHQVLNAPEGNDACQFGTSTDVWTSVENDPTTILAVGCPSSASSTKSSGFVYIYTLGGDGNFALTQTLSSTAPFTSSTAFGYVLKFSHPIFDGGLPVLVVGSPDNEETGTNGFTSVFRRPSALSSFALEATMKELTITTPPSSSSSSSAPSPSHGGFRDVMSYIRMSVAISMDGHVVVVGTPYAVGGTGAVYVYVRQNADLPNFFGKWNHSFRLGEKQSNSNSRFGASVAMTDSNTILIGAPYDNINGKNAGMIYWLDADCSRGSYAYASSTSSDFCGLCPAGTAGLASGLVSIDGCSACNLGTYTGDEGSTVCGPCDEGSYSDATGSSVCQLCSAGTFNSVKASSSKASCIPCPAGYYSKDDGSTRCLPCDESSYADKQGTSICTLCPPGYSGTNTGSASFAEGCSPCRTGYYSTTAGSESCSSCQSGTYQNEAAASTCKLCVVGKYLSGNGATDESDCVTCNPGDYADEPGSNSCDKCPEGTFNTKRGLTSCRNCTAGRTSSSNFNNNGPTSCSLCNSGTFCPHEGCDECQPCPQYV